MIKRIDFICVILLFCLIFCEIGLSQTQSEYALIPRLVWQNPPIWKLTKTVTESNWGTQLFINSRSEAQGYIMTPDYELWSATSFHLDNAWNRIVFQECLANWIYAVGERGSGTGQFLWPSKLDANAPCDYDSFSYYYYIYVADASNDRIVKLRYYWPLGEQVMLWDGTITGGGLSLPQDLDINDGGTHHPHVDDYLWVLNGHEIKRFTLDGVLRKTYGSYGCDGAVGHFCRPTAVVCGRNPWLEPPLHPYANDTWIYVADAGNERLVNLIKWTGSENIYWNKDLNSEYCRHFVDLEADIFGQIWAVDKDNGRIYKYTYDLYPLCYYGSFGTGENQFYYPLSFSNTGGYLGCGNVYVAESWTDNSGGQYFAIGTDIVDFEVTSTVDYRWHYINYTLVDPSDVTIEIYDEQDQLVKTLFDAMEYSGACSHVWDGTDQLGDSVPTGSYRVVVTDSCNYGDPETGEPVNVVVKQTWLHHEYSAGLFPPSTVSGYQSGPDEITLNWILLWPPPDHWFTIYCDGCLCGAVDPLPPTYTDIGLIPDRSYMYWVKAYDEGAESDPSNADTVFLGSKLYFPSVSNIHPVDQSFRDPTLLPKQVDSADIRIISTTVYPGHFTEVEVKLKNEMPICGFNFLIKLSNPNLIDFHTNLISMDSILIDTDWVHYPVRECWIDTSGSLISGFSSLSCRGQVADTALSHCKYLWVKAWAPPDGCIPADPNWLTLFRFGVDAHCLPDSTTDRTVMFDLTFGRVYSPEFEEIPLKYHQGGVTPWWSVPGDANGDSIVDLGDIVYLTDYLYRGGPPPCIPEAGDANGDCEVELGDIVYLIQYLYRGGSPPLPGCWHGKKQ